MTASGILHHVRILDFTRVLAGPYATRLLADFGAEVIKVQPVQLPADETDFARGYYNTWNRNKLSIRLNLDKPEGIALARRLVAVSDAVVENFSPRVMNNWGLDYENLKKIKPDIVMLSMSLMGNTGPWRDYTGFGPAVQAFSGITRLTSFPGKPPVGLGFSYADHVAGLYGVLVLLSALEYRSRTGLGQLIDLSEVEAMAGLLDDAILDYSSGGKVLQPAGNTSAQAAPHNVYRCKGADRWCAIAVFNDAEWRGLKQAMGSPGWAEDAKFATLEGRRKNIIELDEHITAWTLAHTPEEVMELLQARDVPAGAVQDARDVANSPQLRARGFFIEDGANLADASPVKMSRSQASYRKPAPSAGQDNDYVYGQLLGLSGTEIYSLHEKGVI